jgi:hypothetical protein
VVENAAARLSDESYSILMESAARDNVLAEKIGLRADIPPALFRDLLLHTSESVQQRLYASAKPQLRSDIEQVLAKESEPSLAHRPDFNVVEQRIRELRHDGKLDETSVVAFAENKQFEEMIAAIVALCGVSLEVVQRLMCGQRSDPIVILCKSAGWEWPTVKAILMARPGNAPSSEELDTAFANFERLSPTTAQRVTRFWKLQHWDQSGAADE